jgi:hypothetical protein
MTIDKMKARDARARQALVEYSRGGITETACRDELSSCGWGQPNIEKIITAVKANILKLGG